MRTQRTGEGYLQIDHRDSPGITDDEIVRLGMAIPLGHGQENLELPILKCWHCQTMLVRNPLRVRDRGYCPGCDRYLCDLCNDKRIKTGICRPWTQVFDEIIETAIRDTLIKEI